MPTLLLASASPARRSLLTAAGIDALVSVSGVDEDAVLAAARRQAGTLSPEDCVLLLAQAKAEAIATALREGDPELVPQQAPAGDILVLGCDSMLQLGSEIVGKPADADDARRRWRGMRGRTGVLHTGHWLIDARDGANGGGNGAVGAATSTRVHFAEVSDAEIEAYVSSGEPLAVAGAFTIDGLSGPFIDGIDGDPHTVIGLSLPTLRALLRRIGVEIVDLWR